MGRIVSYTSFDYQPVTMVSVIASFDAQGHISPLYVRLEDQPCKVDSFWVKSSYARTMVFQCQVQCGENENELRPLLLTYYLTEGVWSIPQ